jgi:hypothetical protein
MRQLRTAERYQLRFRSRGAGPENNQGLGHSAPFLVRHGNDRGVQDRRVCQDDPFHFERRNIFSPADNQVLLAIGKQGAALFVERGHVPGVEPSAAKCVSGGFRLIPIALHDGWQRILHHALPAVVTTQQGLNEPRYPTLPNIMKAKKKELRRVPLAGYGVSAKLRIAGVEVQLKERRRNIINGKDVNAAAARLVDLLRNEAGVIG